MAIYNINDSSELLLQLVFQDEEDPLRFRFFFKPDHAKSKEFKEWFETHNVKYTVFEQNYEGGTQDACVWFHKNPDMAVLFKLRFG